MTFFYKDAFNELITETNEQDNNKHEQHQLKMNKETTTNVRNEASTSETPEENRTGDKTSSENVGRQFVNVDIEITESFLEENTQKTLRNMRAQRALGRSLEKKVQVTVEPFT